MVAITGKELKELLTTDKAKLILESIGCHDIKQSGKTITAANPQGDNRTAICCYTDSWNVEDNTKGEYQSKKCRDIISFVQFICDLSFPGAMRKICEIIDEDYFFDKIDDKPAFLAFLDFVETGVRKETDGKIEVLPERVLDQFEMIPNKKWLDEGFTVRSMKLFETGIDLDSERITVPIREESGGDLIGIKGRLIDDSKIDGNKYLAIYQYPKTRILFGLWQNYKSIKEKNEVLVFESEKIIIKMHGFGFDNCVSIGGKSLSDYQCEKLLRLEVPITFCLDKDVTFQELEANATKLKFPVQTQPIYALKDTLNLLGIKETPGDNMSTFEVLIKNCKVEI